MVYTDPIQEKTGRPKNTMELVLWTCGFSSQSCTGFARGSSKFLTPGCKLEGRLLLTSQELPGQQGTDVCRVFSKHGCRTFLLWWATLFCCYWPVFLKLVNKGHFREPGVSWCTQSRSLFGSLETGAADSPSHCASTSVSRSILYTHRWGRLPAAMGQGTNFCHLWASGLRQAWSRPTAADHPRHMQ